MTTRIFFLSIKDPIFFLEHLPWLNLCCSTTLYSDHVSTGSENHGNMLRESHESELVGRERKVAKVMGQTNGNGCPTVH